MRTWTRPGRRKTKRNCSSQEWPKRLSTAGRQMGSATKRNRMFTATGLRESLEVLVEHTCQPRTVLAPMLAGRRLLQSFNPVAVEFVHRSIDAITQQPSVTERTAVAERRACRPLSEPREPSQQRLQRFHPCEMLLEPRDGRPADMQQPIAVVVQFE